MIKHISRRSLVAAAIGVSAAATPAFAQEWPSGPLHVYVGFPAGSSPDTIARLIADPLSEALGQPVVIENKPGAGGVIGVQQMLAQKDDGHSFGVTINGPLTTAQRLIPDLGYDPATDIAPVSLIATTPLVLAVSSDNPAEDATSFIETAKASPGEISYGSVGQGSGAHLTAELFASEAGIELFHIPFQSYAEVTTSILGGEIDSGFMAPSAALPHVEAGKMKMLGITSTEPFPQVPEVPVLAGQAGLPDDFRAELWDAFIAPAGTDPEIIERLNTEIVEILGDAEIQDKLLAIGWKAEPGTPEEFAARIKDDTELWGAVIDKTEAQE
ncbi:Bug family tripartite tricarboxylate transporter substrate binding protein [Paracoccus saliphilus]|uniref:Tripartite tricarboxylate transporter substrate binding protein n=1 Tax=Paracoccus saliphilus TaxID=405559 RepID=A0AA45W0N2_9RHOB|nr:tripartite tricarboxylate transporter substrate binding protein [Paracoccus saliphilus]WCR03261.1 tripartite tricarboxylate transporter substrate binding protein [Paracoccus saliphilus]SIS50386.1 Tripartite-type tricarboxylate transporter, receptor component TctC [Paracoccus saliphilus]